VLDLPLFDPGNRASPELIISRALVELFSDPFLREQLRCGGGTALKNLHFPKPLRYSEDIDLTRTDGGPIGASPDFLADVRPLLAASEADNFDEGAARAFATVFLTFIRLIAGRPRARTPEMAEQFGFPELSEDA
jgi:Nucleotidyl transferase AbiEii toxin, Type IV TA system